MNYIYSTFLLLPVFSSIILCYRAVVSDKGSSCQLDIIISKVFSLSYLALLIGISSKSGQIQMESLSSVQALQVSFVFWGDNVLFGYVISIIWIAGVFYLERRDNMRGEKINRRQDLVKISLVLSCISALNFSNNLYSVILFYSLALFVVFVSLSRLFNKDRFKKYIFMSSFISQLLLLIVALFLILIFSNFDIKPGPHLIEQLGFVLGMAVFLLLIIPVVISCMLPLGLMNKDEVRSDNFDLISIFILGIFFSSMIFLNFLAQDFFTIGVFSHLISEYVILILYVICISLMILSIVLVLLTKDIARVLFFILWNQALVSFMVIFSDLSVDGILSCKVIAAFVITMLVLFMVINNIILYIKNNAATQISHFKINIAIFLFIIFSASFIVPPGFVIISSMFEFMDFDFYFLTIIVNSLLLILVALKISMSFFRIYESENQEGSIDRNLSEKSLQLILTPLVVILIMIVTSFLI